MCQKKFSGPEKSKKFSGSENDFSDSEKLRTLSFSILHSFSISNVNKMILCLNIIVIMPISYITNDNWDSFSDSAKKSSQ